MAEKHLTDGTTALAAQPRVIKIEAAEKPENAQLRVAAYTRVSSDSDDQLNSFAAQNRYYAELISDKAEWRMVDIYADATDIIGLKQNPTNGRRFSPIFLLYRAFCGAKHRMPL